MFFYVMTRALTKNSKNNCRIVLNALKVINIKLLFGNCKLMVSRGRGGSLMVSVLAFYSDDPSSILAGYLNFLYEKTKINIIEASVGGFYLLKLLFGNIMAVNLPLWY